MRYAHTQNIEEGIGVEPQISASPRTILVEDVNAINCIVIRSKSQADELIALIKAASAINGWESV